jgi:hypothetical protein
MYGALRAVLRRVLFLRVLNIQLVQPLLFRSRVAEKWKFCLKKVQGGTANDSKIRRSGS